MDWIEVATNMYHKAIAEATKYNEVHEDIKELCFIHAGRAIALSELLEKFGVIAYEKKN